MLDATTNLTLALLANYREILGSSIFLKLTLCKDILQVQTDIVGGGIEQGRHLVLVQPDSFPIKRHFQLRLPVLRDEKLDLLLVRRWHRRHPEKQARKRRSKCSTRRKAA